MKSYVPIVVIFFVLFFLVIGWVFFGKFIVVMFAAHMANNQEAHEIQEAARAERAAKRAARRVKQDEEAAQVIQNEAVQNEPTQNDAAPNDAAPNDAAPNNVAPNDAAPNDATHTCSACKNHQGGAPTAVSDITDYQECCERHRVEPVDATKSAPPPPVHVRDMASTASNVS